MNKSEAERRVQKCIRKTSDVITIRVVEGGKQEASMNAIQHMSDGQFDEYMAGKHAQDDDIPSASASAEAPARLEDLAPIEIDTLETLMNDGIVVYKPRREKLEALGLIFTGGDGISEITAKGEQWVADYQQRQASDERQQERGADEETRLADRAKAWDCSISTMRFIEMLESRIRTLENRLDTSK